MPAPETDTFVCRRCGQCCRPRGYVHLASDEPDAIAAWLGLTPREFIERYTRVTPDRRGLSLIERADGACVFLDDPPACAIEAVKPAQCRGFPLRWRTPDQAARCHGLRARD